MQRTALGVHRSAHVCVAQVASMQPERLENFLDPAERARSANFHSQSARQRFIGGRVLLRTVLGEFVGVAPQKLRFDHGPAGKPRVANELADSVLFSLAHSGELVLVAVSATSEVGVDVERIRPIPNAMEIAARVFDSPGCTALSETAPEHRDAAFLQDWTRLEALAKATGWGLVRLLEHTKDSMGPRGRFEVIDLPLESGYVGALAVESIVL